MNSVGSPERGPRSYFNAPMLILPMLSWPAARVLYFSFFSFQSFWTAAKVLGGTVSPYFASNAPHVYYKDGQRSRRCFYSVVFRPLARFAERIARFFCAVSAFFAHAFWKPEFPSAATTFLAFCRPGCPRALLIAQAFCNADRPRAPAFTTAFLVIIIKACRQECLGW